MSSRYTNDQEYVDTCLLFDGIKFCYKIINRKTLDYFYSLLEDRTTINMCAIAKLTSVSITHYRVVLLFKKFIDRSRIFMQVVRVCEISIMESILYIISVNFQARTIKIRTTLVKSFCVYLIPR